MLTDFFRRSSTIEQYAQLEEIPFEPIRTSNKEGILDVEEVEYRMAGGTDTGYNFFVRTEKVKGELLEIVDYTKRYNGHITSTDLSDLHNPIEHVKGVKLIIRDDEGVEGDVFFPEEFPSRLDRRALLNQRVEYEHKRDRMCERYPNEENRLHRYSLTILTGQLEGENYLQRKFENL